MSFEEKYLIVSDLDGTFFGEKGAILPRNLEAIRSFQKKGGMFTLATGRSVAILHFIFPEASEYASGPAILSGGACLYDLKNHVELDRRDLDKELAKRVIRETREAFPDAGYRICTDRGYLTDHMTEHLAKHLSRFSSVTTVDDLDRHLDRTWYKLTYSVPADQKPPLKEFLDSYRESFYISGSSPYLTEMLDPSASKGQQIANLKRLYPGRTLICIGDYDNDLDMLRAADIAACPANANDTVKHTASIHLCDHKNACIADLIDKLQEQN